MSANETLLEEEVNKLKKALEDICDLAFSKEPVHPNAKKGIVSSTAFALSSRLNECRRIARTALGRPTSY